MTESEWTALLHDLRNVDDIDVMVRACERLHRNATAEDLPRLRILLDDEDSFIREAAAWPLSEIAGASALPELLRAFQRGLDARDDIDGFSTALADLAAADPKGVRSSLE